jgi:hypothetical protein
MPAAERARFCPTAVNATWGNSDPRTVSFPRIPASNRQPGKENHQRPPAATFFSTLLDHHVREAAVG